LKALLPGKTVLPHQILGEDCFSFALQPDGEHFEIIIVLNLVEEMIFQEGESNPPKSSALPLFHPVFLLVFFLGKLSIKLSWSRKNLM
jgi:hypothetical protein